MVLRGVIPRLVRGVIRSWRGLLLLAVSHLRLSLVVTSLGRRTTAVIRTLLAGMGAVGDLRRLTSVVGLLGLVEAVGGWCAFSWFLGHFFFWFGD